MSVCVLFWCDSCVLLFYLISGFLCDFYLKFVFFFFRMLLHFSIAVVFFFFFCHHNHFGLYIHTHIYMLTHKICVYNYVKNNTHQIYGFKGFVFIIFWIDLYGHVCVSVCGHAVFYWVLLLLVGFCGFLCVWCVYLTVLLTR